MAKKIRKYIFENVQIQEKAAELIANKLEEKLKAQDVLLFLSGGSAIGMYKLMFEYLAKKKEAIQNLTVTLFDERFVNINSSDTNEMQLKAIGVLKLLKKLRVRWRGYLQDQQNPSGEKTAASVNERLQEIMQEKPWVMILAGIGSDGHTAGILPTNDDEVISKVYESENLVEYYQLPKDTENRYRERITATPALVEKADAVIVYAVGEDKRPALANFIAGQKLENELPALILKRSKRPVIMLTDQVI